MNKVFLIGNLTRDPEAATTPSGISICKFSIAVNRPFANADGNRESDFFNIVTWRGLADNCGKYLAKGKKVAVCGYIQNRTYEDKDGNKRYATDIVADDVEFLTPKNEGQGNYEPRQNAGSNGGAGELKPVESDDLPF